VTFEFEIMLMWIALTFCVVAMAMYAFGVSLSEESLTR
jgi:hypothetical protein